jgi:peptide/nickel transport system substrate-binding protein
MSTSATRGNSSKWAPRARRPVRHVAVSLLAAVLVLAGCSFSGSTPAEPAAVRTSLRIATGFQIASLDPVTEGYWAPEFGYGELLMKSKAQGSVEPWLLQSLTSTSPTTWLLSLRPKVTFQNGKPLTGAVLSELMTYLLKANPDLAGLLPGATVRALNDTDVELTTARPQANVPNLLADEGLFTIFDLESVRQAGSDRTALLGKKIWTGPYVVTSLTSAGMRLEWNPAYWGGKPPLKSVTLTFISDPQARVLAVQNGEVDLALYPETAAARSLAGRNDAFFRTTERGKPSARLVLNLKQAPFDDERVRRAVSLGIDYQEIATKVMPAAYDTAIGMYPDYLPFAVKDQVTDPRRAAQLLDEAGWTAGSSGARTKAGKPLEITLLTYPQQPDFQPMAVAVQAQLLKIGIQVRIQQVDDIYGAFKQPGWHAGILGAGSVGAGGEVIVPLINYLTSKGSRNVGGVVDPELDRLVAEAAATHDEAARGDLLRRIQEIAVGKAYVAFLAVKRGAVVVGSQWRDYTPPPDNRWVEATTGAGAPR